ncbi:hypothetical protein D3C77_209400 [compost metagenome]
MEEARCGFAQFADWMLQALFSERLDDDANGRELGGQRIRHVSTQADLLHNYAHSAQLGTDSHLRHVLGLTLAALGSVGVDNAQAVLLGQGLHVFPVLVERACQVPDVVLAHDFFLSEPGDVPGPLSLDYLEASPIRAVPAVCLMLVAVLSQLVPVASSASVGDLPPATVSQV